MSDKRTYMNLNGIAVMLVSSILIIVGFAAVSRAQSDRSRPFEVAQSVSYSAWRPYSNPNRLVSVGMNKGEVLAIAGKPDHEESYYQSSGGRLVRISDWYYIRTGHDPETTLLKFVEESLVSISTTPIPR